MGSAQPTVTKRFREKARLEKKQRKAQLKAEREAMKKAAQEEGGVPVDDDIDPDIAGIRPGPQKPNW